MAEQSKKRKTEKDSPSRQLNMQGPGEDALKEIVKKVAIPYGSFHGAFRENWLATHETHLPVEDSSVCPFCGWDCRGAHIGGEECPHLLTELLCDWDEISPEGTARGALEHVAKASFRSLNQAVSRFLRTSKGDKKRITSMNPARLRRLVGTVAEGAHFAGRDADRSFRSDMEGFGQYVVDACSAARVEVRRTHYDSGDPFGTSPYLFWAADALKAATEMARLVAEDVGRLNVTARRIRQCSKQ